MKLMIIELPTEVYDRISIRAAIDNLTPEQGTAALLTALVQDWQERQAKCE